jgi:hypothetical protein
MAPLSSTLVSSLTQLDIRRAVHTHVTESANAASDWCCSERSSPWTPFRSRADIAPLERFTFDLKSIENADHVSGALAGAPGLNHTP